MRTYRILLQILGVLLILVGIKLYNLFSFLGAFGLLICLLCVIPGLFFLLASIYLKYKSEQDSQTSSPSPSQLPDWLQSNPTPSSTETSSPNVSPSSSPTPRVTNDRPAETTAGFSNLTQNPLHSNNSSRNTNNNSLPDWLTNNSQPGPVDIKPFGPYPGQKDGHPLQYSYNRPFTKIPGIDIRADVLVDREREVDVQANGDLIELVFNGKVIGTISDSSKAQMVSDWKRKGFPCSAIVLRSCVEVVLRFYRDKRIGNEHRQQNVFALTAYKSDDKQDTILCLSPSDELDLEEDWDHEDSVIVLGIGEPIGKLPKKYATKYLNEGAYCVYFEKYEEVDDEYNYIVKPFIRIYW